MRTLRRNAGHLKYRPVIAGGVDIPLDENMKTQESAVVFIMATFENQPISNIPLLYQHFVRHTNSPDTAPWPPEGKDAIIIQPHMRHPNQYVMAISFTIPARTEIHFHGVSDSKTFKPKYMVCKESIRDLIDSYPQLLKDLPPEYASAKVAKTQAKLLREGYKDNGHVSCPLSCDE